MAEGHKKEAERLSGAKSADGPDNNMVATRANLKKWIARLCKEIKLAKAAYAAAQAACK